MYAGRSGGSFHDVLETLKTEYDKLVREANHFKTQRDESERKLQTQIGEMASVHNSIKELERKHTALKHQYEEELYRLQSSHRPQSNLPGGSHPLGDRKPTAKFPALSASTIQDTSFGMPSTLGKRRLEENGAGGPAQSLPRLEMPHSDKDGRNGAAQNRPRLQLGQDGPKEEFSSQPQLPQLYPNGPSSSQGAPKQPQLASPQRQVLPPQQQLSQQQLPQQQPQPGPGQRQSLPPSEANGGDEDFKLVLTHSVQTNLKIEMAKDIEHSSVVCCVRFSADGKYLATGSNKVAQIYSVEDGSPVATFSDMSADGSDLYLRSICFSPDGQYLACGAEDRTVKLWDIGRKEIAHTFTGHGMDIYSVDYSQDGRFIVSGSGDKKARIWDVEKRKCLFILGNDEVGPKDGVTSVAMSPDGRLIAAGSLDRVVRLWDAQTGYFLERYEGHTDSVYSVAFSPDGKSLASGSLDKTLKLWDLSESRARSQCRSTFSGHSDFVLSVAFSPNGNWLVSGSKDRTVQFWDPRSTVSHAILEGHKNSVISVAVNPSNGSFATGSGDLHAKLWRYSVY